MTSILIGGENSDRNILSHTGLCDEGEDSHLQRQAEKQQKKSTTVFFFFFGHTCGRWDLSSPTRNRTHAPCTGSLGAV